jgi:transcriptional regulator with XRE-family HTH domain
MDSRREELKAFLRARRAAVTPDAVGLKVAMRRRTPGLRREEVAQLADVGVTWYTWLEQGRAIRVSRDALGRIAHALRLSTSDTSYLFTLAQVEDSPTVAPPEPDERLRLAVSSIDRVPAFAVNPLFDVVAFNRIADRIYRFDEVTGVFAKNHLWRVFADPKRMALYDDSWDRVATSGVGLLRANYAARAGDPAFEALLSALRVFPEFVRRWDAQYTAPTAQLLIGHVYRADLGHVRFFSLRLLLPELPGFILFVLPPADEPAVRILERLAQDGRGPVRPMSKGRTR